MKEDTHTHTHKTNSLMQHYWLSYLKSARFAPQRCSRARHLAVQIRMSRGIEPTNTFFLDVLKISGGNTGQQLSFLALNLSVVQTRVALVPSALGRVQGALRPQLLSVTGERKGSLFSVSSRRHLKVSGWERHQLQTQFGATRYGD